jgi:hypothetical protein
MITAARRELVQAGVEQSPEVVLADAGYGKRRRSVKTSRERASIVTEPDALVDGRGV